MVLLALMPHRQHHDLRGTDNLIRRNIPGSPEWDDQFSLHGVLRRLAEAEGCDRKLPLCDRSDGVDCRLGIVEIFGCLGASLSQDRFKPFTLDDAEELQ